MADTNETIADIIAEARDKYTVHECNQCAWRKCCSRGFGSEECGKFRESIFLHLGIEDGYFTQLLDRLEAARKREVQNALDVGGFVEASRKNKQVGDAAKLREAVILLMDALADMITCNGKREKNRAAMDAGRAALAAPARNCDKFTSLFDAWLEWQAYCAVHKMAAMEFPPWLYDIAQESEVAK